MVSFVDVIITVKVVYFFTDTGDYKFRTYLLTYLLTYSLTHSLTS